MALFNVNITEKIQSWATSMGFNFEKTPAEFSSMSKDQIEIWLHIMKHVRPKQEVQICRKNMLLHNVNASEVSIKKQGKVFCNEKLIKQQQLKNLKEQLNLQCETLKSIENEVEEKKSQLEARDLQIQNMESKVKETNQKLLLLNLMVKCTEEKLKEYDESIKVLDITFDVLNNKTIDCTYENNDQIKQCEKIIEECFDNIDAAYHSYWLNINGDVQQSDAIENNRAWDKFYDAWIQVPANVMFEYLLKNMKEVNKHMDEFCKSYAKHCSGSSINPQLMDEIRFNNIKIFLNVSSSSNRIEKLNAEINEVKKELRELLRNDSKFQEYDNDKLDEVIEIIVYKKESNLNQTKYSDLSDKIDSLKTETDLLEFHKRTCENLLKKINLIDEKIDEKIKRISQYASDVMNQKYLKLQEASKNAITEVINRYSLNSSNTSDNSSNDCYVQLQDSFKDEVEIFLQIPLNKLQEQHLKKDIFNSTDQIFLLHNVFMSKLWMRILIKFIKTINQSSMQSSNVDVQNILASKESRESSDVNFDEFMKLVKDHTNSAKQLLLGSIDIFQLLNDDDFSGLVLKHVP